MAIANVELMYVASCSLRIDVGTNGAMDDVDESGSTCSVDVALVIESRLQLTNTIIV